MPGFSPVIGKPIFYRREAVWGVLFRASGEVGGLFDLGQTQHFG